MEISDTSTVATAFASPVPKPRPKVPAVLEVRYGQNGSVCGVNAIRGQNLKAVPGRVSGCGIQKPVQITEISGVKLSTPAMVDCGTAKALHSWIEKGAKPSVGRLGGGLAQLEVAASYVCRPRNNQAGAKISEHGRGRAIDISAVLLENGTRITVLEGWNDPVRGPLMRKLHRAGCGPFGTVLGPESDVYHRDHFHFDTARYRSGSYCR
nr:extensin family protein [Celeribacter sp. PS-C1]